MYTHLIATHNIASKRVHAAPRRPAAAAFRWLLQQTAGDVTPDDLRRSAAVFSPHPDDECLGCAGTILRKTDAGASVTMVHMTDGSASTSLIPAEELKAIRRREALNAARVLGVRDTIFLEFKDGKLSENLQAGADRVADILEQLRPEQVFVPWRHEPMKQAADHVAAARIVHAALRRVGQRAGLWEYPVWAWLHWPWIGLRQPGPPMRTKHVLWNSAGLLFGARAILNWRRSVDVAGVLERKWSALAQHRSQMERMVPAEGYMTLADVCQGEFLDCFLRDREYFRVYADSGRQ